MPMNYPEGPSLGPLDISDSFPKFTGMRGHQKSLSMSSFIVLQAAGCSMKNADKNEIFCARKLFFQIFNSVLDEWTMSIEKLFVLGLGLKIKRPSLKIVTNRR